MKNFLFVLVAVAALSLAPCAWAATATAVIKGTAEGSLIDGEATFTETDTGLDVEVNIANAPAGKHGFHIHENGSCDDQGKAAGGHYNPDGVMHGMVAKDGFEHAHAGDFGNIEIAADGTGTLNVFIPGLTLTGEQHNVAGKAVILHEKEDDFGQPTGNAGSRIGCGVILLDTASGAADDQAEQGGEIMDESPDMDGDSDSEDNGAVTTDQADSMPQAMEQGNTDTAAPQAVSQNDANTATGTTRMPRVIEKGDDNTVVGPSVDVPPAISQTK